MAIYADQNNAKSWHWSKIPLNANNCRLISIDQNWSTLGSMPEFWLALGIDPGSPEYRDFHVVESVISERGLILWEKKSVCNMDFECIKYLKIGTIFNHSSYRDAILQFDFFRLKDRWPTDWTICLCVCHQGPYPENLTDAVYRLLIWICGRKYDTMS